MSSFFIYESNNKFEMYEYSLYEWVDIVKISRANKTTYSLGAAFVVLTTLIIWYFDVLPEWLKGCAILFETLSAIFLIPTLFEGGEILIKDNDLFYTSGVVKDERLEHEYITICSISENPTVSILTLNSNRYPEYADLEGYYCILNDKPVKISNPEYLTLYGITKDVVISYTNSVLAKYGRHRSRGEKNRFYDSMKGFYEKYFGPKSKEKEK